MDTVSFNCPLSYIQKGVSLKLYFFLSSEFVEPVQFDLGRIFSECGPSQPIVFTVKGPNQAKSDIRKFAQEREKDLIQLSMGSDDVR